MEILYKKTKSSQIYPLGPALFVHFKLTWNGAIILKSYIHIQFTSLNCSAPMCIFVCKYVYLF